MDFNRIMAAGLLTLVIVSSMTVLVLFIPNLNRIMASDLLGVLVSILKKAVILSSIILLFRFLKASLSRGDK